MVDPLQFKQWLKLFSTIFNFQPNEWKETLTHTKNLFILDCLPFFRRIKSKLPLSRNEILWFLMSNGFWNRFYGQIRLLSLMIRRLFALVTPKKKRVELKFGKHWAEKVIAKLRESENEERKKNNTTHTTIFEWKMIWFTALKLFRRVLGIFDVIPTKSY